MDDFLCVFKLNFETGQSVSFSSNSNTVPARRINGDCSSSTHMDEVYEIGGEEDNVVLDSNDNGGERRSISNISNSHDRNAPFMVTATIVNAKPMVGTLMRAITSVKLSPANRHLLLGFGVRIDGRVQEHKNP
jgi:hypothetical protein